MQEEIDKMEETIENGDELDIFIYEELYFTKTI